MQTITPAPPDARRRVAVAAVAGHVVEWYEFSIYGVLAAYIAVSVFPSADPVSSLTLAWAGFAIAFLIRPVGGLVLARLADREGRRKALVLSVAMMTAATVGLGLLPGSAAIGLGAPLLFLGLRLLQGFAVGGEMPSAVPYLAEALSPERRSRGLSVLAAGTFVSSLAGALIAAGLAAMLTPEAMQLWGWRVPFLLALPLGLAALAARRRAPESPEFERLVAGGGRSEHPLREALRTSWRPILLFGTLALSFNVAIAVCVSGLLTEVLVSGLPAAQALWVTVVSYGGIILAVLGGGRLMARIGSRTAVLAGAGTALVLVAPAVSLARSGTVLPAVLGCLLLAVPIGLLATPTYLALAGMFPAAVRASAGAIAFNAATALSSLVPVTALALRGALGFDGGLVLWVAAAAGLTCVVVLRSPRSLDPVD